MFSRSVSTVNKMLQFKKCGSRMKLPLQELQHQYFSMRNFAHSIQLFNFDLLNYLPKFSEQYQKCSFALKIKEKLVPNFVQYFRDIQKHSSCIKKTEQISKDFCISWVITNNCCTRTKWFETWLVLRNWFILDERIKWLFWL